MISDAPYLCNRCGLAGERAYLAANFASPSLARFCRYYYGDDAEILRGARIRDFRRLLRDVDAPKVPLDRSAKVRVLPAPLLHQVRPSRTLPVQELVH